MHSRRFVMKTALLCAVAMTSLAAPAHAQTMKKLTIQLAWLPDYGSTGEIVALKKGYFTKRGLDVTILPGGPNSNPIQELLGETSDIAVAYAPQIMYSAAKKLPIISFAASYQKAPLTYFSLADRNIKSVKDWKGKRIGSAQDAIPQVKAILRNNGLKFEDITFVQAGVPALMQDQVDVVGAWPMNVASLAPVISSPGGYNTQSIWDNGLQFQSNYYVVRKDSIKADADTLTKFLEAVDEGWNYAADNQEDAIASLVEYAPTLERDKQLASLKIVLNGYIYTDETKTLGFANVSPDRWANSLNAYAELGEIPNTVKVSDVFDDSILNAAKRTKR